MEKIKVIVVDDHPMVIEGMRAMLSQINFVTLTATAENASEALEKIKGNTPDVIITDINLPQVSGIELTVILKKKYPTVKVIAMSTFNERSYISQMIQNGADGYLVKSASKEAIEEAIYSVYEGKMYLSVDVNLPISGKNELKNQPIISLREKEVLALIADGFTNPQIAEKLFISLHTVDSHRKNLLTKFSVNNSAALIREAAKMGLL